MPRRHRGRLPTAALILVAGLLAPRAAPADARIAEIQKRNVLTCGGVERPGLASSVDGTWRGSELELCRDLARTLLGPGGRFRFHIYDIDADFDALRRGEEDIAFLSRTEAEERHLVPGLIAGPTLLQLTQSAMVAAASPVRSLSDLQGRSVCFIAGSLAEDALNRWLRTHKLDVERAPFSEDGEMMDAFHVGHCDAVVAEAPFLTGQRDAKSSSRGADRILREPLAAEPLAIYVPKSAGAPLLAAVSTFLAARAGTTARAP